jgi:hypothetical protein
LENPDANVLTTILDVDGVEFHINALGEVSEGASFQIFLADSIVGTPTIATEGWSFDAATGSITLGTEIVEIQGDIDGNGTVEFADFLVLSNTFGNAADPAGSGADIDGNGTVEFADFLILSENFGADVEPGTNGDIDGNGKVEFGDFLTLSENFGKSVGEAAVIARSPSTTDLVFASLSQDLEEGEDDLRLELLG